MPKRSDSIDPLDPQEAMDAGDLSGYDAEEIVPLDEEPARPRKKAAKLAKDDSPAVFDAFASKRKKVDEDANVEELALRAKNGDEQAAADLFEHVKFFLKGKANRIVRKITNAQEGIQKADKDEAAQRGALAFMAALHTWRPEEGPFWTYLAGKPLLTHVGRPTRKETFGMGEHDGFKRRDIQALQKELRETEQVVPTAEAIAVEQLLRADPDRARGLAEELLAETGREPSRAALRKAFMQRIVPGMVVEKRRLDLPDDARSDDEALRRMLQTRLHATMGKPLLRKLLGRDPREADLSDLVPAWLDVILEDVEDAASHLRHRLEELGGEEAGEASVFDLVPQVIAAEIARERGSRTANRREVKGRLIAEVGSRLALRAVDKMSGDGSLASLVRLDEVARIFAEEGSLPDDKRVARAMLERVAVDPLKVVETLAGHTTHVASFDEPVGEDGSRTHGDIIAADDALDPTDRAEREYVVAAMGREIHATGRPAHPLARAFVLLRSGYSLSDTQRPAMIHRPLTRGEVAGLFGVQAQTVGNNESVAGRAIEGDIEIPGVEVPVVGPDGKEHMVRRTVVATLHPEKKARKEQVLREWKRGGR
jgi:hypothetical protein